MLRICEAVRAAGGRAVLVGGWVRDWLHGFESKDFDIEVYALEAARLRSVLESIARVNAVGEHFSVYKLVFQPQAPTNQQANQQAAAGDQNDERVEIDVSIPRRESKSGRGHRAFVIEGDPAMTFEEAARRRDFTINAIMYDPLTKEIIDPYWGEKDFKQRTLRAVSADTFIEDSLRVLRAVQLAARFEMTVEPKTAELCRSIDLSDLPSERIWGEIEKLLVLAERPSIGLQIALELDVLAKLFPEIRALAGCRLDNSSKMTDDAFAHTRTGMDESVKLARDLAKPQRIAVMLATLCNDLGKPLAAQHTDKEAIDLGQLGVEPARAVMKTLGLHTLAGYDVRSQVLALVREHLRPTQFHELREEVSDGDFRRLAQRVDLDLLYRVAKACALARGTASSSIAEDWFIERARKLGVEHGPPEPLLLGRHLIEAGYAPGPEMGRVLRNVYELQLDGKVTTLDEAVAAANSLT
ncbi:MAG TPA: hypothetical protein VNS63_08465 [Blastocatellia bacterium]|nr:hypothetical protein [Blastocatellia bacterium]